VISIGAAANHLLKVHGINIDDNTPSTITQAIQTDLRSVFSTQEIQNNLNEEQKVHDNLRSTADKTTVRQALLRLIVHHDLPLSIVQWPEFYTLVYSLNYQATSCI
jgi:3-methyladenine DNA glycosylase AlkC